MSMIVSAIVGWVCGKLGDNVLKSVFENSELNRKIEGVVSKWAKSQAAFVEPEALFEAVDLVREGDQRREYVALQGNLLRCEWPDENQWHRAFMEQWRYVLKTNEEVQAFFQLDEAEASEELRKLARAVQDLRKEYDKVFKWFVVDNLSWIREYLRDHLPGMTVRDIRACRVSLAKLPVTGRELFGRNGELGGLDEAWEDEGTKIISFVAWGGVGKTALVNEWLNRMGEKGWGGAECVYGWSFYSQGTKEDRQANSDVFIANTLEWFGDVETAKSSKSPWEKGVRLAELIRGQKTLLILDGVEPLQHPPGPMAGRLKDQGLQGLLRELSHGMEGLCVITTREKIEDLDGQVGHTVRRVELENLSPSAGMEVLREAGVTNGTDEELKETSEEFGGHALALNLLGNYLAVVHGGEIRKRDRVPTLMEEEKKGGHAKRVMESYEIWLKGKAEVDILYLMGLFDRPAEAGAIEKLREKPAIEGLTENIVNLSEAKWKYSVNRLRELKLLGADDGSGGLDCHPLVREHFGEKLKDEKPGGWREAHGRLYEYYKGVPGKDLPDTLEEMEPLFRAVYHGCVAGRHKETFDEVYWERIFRGDEAFVNKQLGAFGSDLGAVACFFEHLWDRPAVGLSEHWKAGVLTWAGFGLRAVGRLREAALVLFEKRDNWQECAVNASNLSEVYLTLGDVGKAVKYGRRCVEYADKSGDLFQRMSKRTALADALHQAGEVEEARGLFEEAERIQQERQPEYRYLYSLQGYNYCDLLLAEGKTGEVKERIKKCFEWRLVSDSLLTIALENLALGRALLAEAARKIKGQKSRIKSAEKRLDEALRHSSGQAKRWLDEAVAGLRKAGTQHHIPRGLFARAGYWRATGDYEEARRDLDEAREIAERGGMKLHLADYHLEAARLARSDKDKKGAAEHCGKAKVLIAECGYHRRDVEVCELMSDD